MTRRTVIGIEPPSPEKMAWLDKQTIDPMNTKQVGLLAQILHVNEGCEVSGCGGAGVPCVCNPEARMPLGFQVIASRELDS